MATKKEGTIIHVPELKLETIHLDIIGYTPFYSHGWSEESKKRMLDTMMKVPQTKRPQKNPFNEALGGLYWLSEIPDDITMENFFEKSKTAKFGVKTIAFKKCAATGGYRAGITKDIVSILGAMQFIGELVEIKGTLELTEEPVRVGKGAADLRYRFRFSDWSTQLSIRFNTNVLSQEQLVNLLNIGGFTVGVGDWRVEKSGQNGMFRVG